MIERDEDSKKSHPALSVSSHRSSRFFNIHHRTRIELAASAARSNWPMLMLLAIVPTADSILPPGPKGIANPPGGLFPQSASPSISTAGPTLGRCYAQQAIGKTEGSKPPPAIKRRVIADVEILHRGTLCVSVVFSDSQRGGDPL